MGVHGLLPFLDIVDRLAGEEQETIGYVHCDRLVSRRMAGRCDGSNTGRNFDVAVALDIEKLGTFNAASYRVARMRCCGPLLALDKDGYTPKFPEPAGVIKVQMADDDLRDVAARDTRVAKGIQQRTRSRLKCLYHPRFLRAETRID